MGQPTEGALIALAMKVGWLLKLSCVLVLIRSLFPGKTITCFIWLQRERDNAVLTDLVIYQEENLYKLMFTSRLLTQVDKDIFAAITRATRHSYNRTCLHARKFGLLFFVFSSQHSKVGFFLVLLQK